MKVLLLAILVASATSDVSHLQNSGYQYPVPPQPAPSPDSNIAGYQYPVPAPSKPISTSYGVPQASVLGNYGQSINYNSGPSNIVRPAISPTVPKISADSGFQLPVLTHPAVPFQQSTNSFYLSPAVPVGTPQVASIQSEPSILTTDDAQANSAPQTSGNYQFGTGQNDAALNSGVGYANSQSYSQSVSQKFQHSNTATYTTNSQTSNLAPEVTKHLYFFTGPEDEEIKTKVNFPAVAPKQNYKIIFIKAPSYVGQSSINIPAPPPTEERTLVYVLVKKPEDQTDVNVGVAPTLAPTKPEVFFIKYNTQKEVENAIADIQNQHGANAQQITTGQGAFINGLGGNVGTSFVDSGLSADLPNNVGASSATFQSSGTFGTQDSSDSTPNVVGGNVLYTSPSKKYVPSPPGNQII